MCKKFSLVIFFLHFNITVDSTSIWYQISSHYVHVRLKHSTHNCNTGHTMDFPCIVRPPIQSGMQEWSLILKAILKWTVVYIINMLSLRFDLNIEASCKMEVLNHKLSLTL